MNKHFLLLFLPRSLNYHKPSIFFPSDNETAWTTTHSFTFFTSKSQLSQTFHSSSSQITKQTLTNHSFSHYHISASLTQTIRSFLQMSTQTEVILFFNSFHLSVTIILSYTLSTIASQSSQTFHPSSPLKQRNKDWNTQVWTRNNMQLVQTLRFTLSYFPGSLIFLSPRYIFHLWSIGRVIGWPAVSLSSSGREAKAHKTVDKSLLARQTRLKASVNLSIIQLKSIVSP